MTHPNKFVRIFLVFGAAYLLSSLLRGVTAALASSFVLDFDLASSELGLLGGSYFLGFALMQLPAGAWLDRYGAKRVLAASLVLAALGSCMFSLAQSLSALVVARFACGVGVSACLIAPLTAARQWLTPAKQQQVNLWMLMAGALGLLMATLPTQIVANTFGWRTIFLATAFLFVVLIALILVSIPDTASNAGQKVAWYRSYVEVVRSRYTWQIAPLGFFSYAILVAIQTLWAGPWLTQVSGVSASEAAKGLFYINLVMLAVFLGMGFVTPWVVKSKAGAEGVLKVVLPFSLVALYLLPIMGLDASWVHFCFYCIASAVLALTHPAVGQNFPPHLAGRAIAFFNLLLFLGVFAIQWGVGKIITWMTQHQGGTLLAYQVAFYVLAVLSTLSYFWFLAFDKFFTIGDVRLDDIGFRKL
jgi:MFS family permease